MILRAVALLALLAMHAITNYKELKKTTTITIL
jgi:hypothetical protein